MKNKIRSVLLGAALLGCALFTTHNADAQYLDFAQGIQINGSGTTNVNVAGTNLAWGVLNAFMTNTYNLGFPQGQQLSTNSWPSVPLVSSYGLHNRYLFLSGTVQANGATNGQEVLTLAGCANGMSNSIFATNLWVINIPYSGTTVTAWATNIDTQGIPFIFVQALGNTNSACVITNIFAQPVSKLYN